MPSISNDSISIDVALKGAELQSIYHKHYRLDYMWGGDPAYWGKHSPVLFPIVGELKDGQYSYKGKEYQLNRHGFVRDLDFSLTYQSEASAIFTLESNEQTLQHFPFDFAFSVKYTLVGSTVQITFLVENKGNDRMYFSVGGHPAFKVPLVEGSLFEDYQLVFAESETVARWPISPAGLIEKEPVPFLDNQQVLPLTKELFASDAIVFKALKSRSVSIESSATEHGVKVAFEEFPYLGIWEGKSGDFVCIEPWCGIADSVDSTGNLVEKEGINDLKPGGKFNATYTIEVF